MSTASWYASPEWWLVIIAGLTGMAIAYQAYEMRRATEQMQTTNRLQKLGLRQWVDLKEWNTGKSPIRPENHLLIGFQIANPTQAPLEITDVINTVSGGKINRESNIGLVSPGNPYVVALPVHLTDEQMTAFENRRLVLMVRCEVFFTDVMNQKWHQLFERMVVCEPGKIWATDRKNTLVRDETGQDKKPN